MSLALEQEQTELQARARRFVEEVLFPLEEKAERREIGRASCRERV